MNQPEIVWELQLPIIVKPTRNFPGVTFAYHSEPNFLGVVIAYHCEPTKNCLGVVISYHNEPARNCLGVVIFYHCEPYRVYRICGKMYHLI